MKVKFNKFPSDVQEVLDQSNSAKMNLSRLEKGTSDTARTWFYENKSPDELIKPVVSALEGMTEWPEIASWDLSKIDKFQAQGRAAAFNERLDAFDEYFLHMTRPKVFNTKRWQDAKRRAIKRLKLNSTGKPITIAEVVERGVSDQKLNTSSGYPLYIKRKNPEAISEATAAAESGKCYRDRYPFMVGSRAQMGKVGPQARFIFMAPMAVNLAGQRFAHPIQDYLTKLSEKKLRSHVRIAKNLKLDDEIRADHEFRVDNDSYLTFFTPWLGWDRVQEVISEYWSTSTVRFGADYTKMDQHFNKYHALEVYDVVKHYFRKEYWDELKEVMLYPFTAPIITSSGYVDQEHALLSGSEWTNLVETIFNFILLEYINLDIFEGEWPEYNTTVTPVPMGIGDDQLWLLIIDDKKGIAPADYDRLLRDILNIFEAVGLPGNPDKQEGIEEPEESGFLQRHMWSDYNGPDNSVPAAGVYPLIRNVTSQVYPERYHNDKEYDWKAFAIRVIMIAENCCNHPLFDWYVREFVAKANSNILRFVRLTDSEINKHWNTVKNIAGFRPNYNQEKQDKPLTQFETFRILREVAAATPIAPAEMQRHNGNPDNK